MDLYPPARNIEQIARTLSTVSGSTGSPPMNQALWKTCQVFSRESCDDMFEGATMSSENCWRAACLDAAVAAAANAAVRSPRCEIDMTGANARPWAAATDVPTVGLTATSIRSLVESQREISKHRRG